MEVGDHVRLYASQRTPHNPVLKSEYPEDLFREACHQDTVYGSIDLTERDTSL